MNNPKSNVNALQKPRLTSIDILRGASIIAIVSYHVIQRWPFEVSSLIRYISSYGQYGVDVFFALSGLLVGISTARSFSGTGNQSDEVILLQRLIRVYIPYLVALAVAYMGVSTLKNVPFHTSFVFLVQNYLTQIPFFLVSWFLCIICAFYLLAYLLPRINGNSRARSALLLLMFSISCPIQRCFLVVQGAVNEDTPFGFYFTATHLRADSIAISFSLGLVIEKIITRIKFFNSNRRIPILAILVVAATPLFYVKLCTFHAQYILAPFFAAIPSVLLATHAYLNPQGIRGLSWALSRVSSIAFSLYLTHPFAIEASARAKILLQLNQGGMLLTLFLSIGIFTAVFFAFVEAPSRRLALTVISSKLLS